MANPLLLTLFLIISTAAVDFTAAATTTPTTVTITTTAVNSTTNTTAATTVNSTIPTTTNTINIISAAVNSRKSATKTTGAKHSISPNELDNLLRVLTYSGYPLFSNAIDTSDVQFQILTGTDEATTPPASFTIFAPRDHFLYTLDMASDADAYVAAIRSHVIPSRRLTIDELRNLTTPYLDTLLPHYSMLVEKSKSEDDFVTVDGVRVSDPDLFVGSRFVVHGLDGILLTGFNMYEDTLSLMGKGFFAPEKVDPSSQNSAAAAAAVLPAAKNGEFSRVMRKHRKLQYRRIWKSNYSARRSNGEDDF